MSATTPLRQRTIDTLRLGHYSERTITTYIDWLARLAERNIKKTMAEASPASYNPHR